jgi:hypothetical protein
MRWIAAAAFLMMIGAAQAQTTTQSTTAAPAATATPPAAATPAVPDVRHRRTMQERFDEANTTHDGHLTAEQARAKMPAVSRDFTAIDKDHKGYVTMDDIKAHDAAKRAATRAAKKAAATAKAQ